MKVGILSKHRVVNYGSFLQAFALKSMIEGMGHKVYFMDLKPEEGKDVNYLFDEPRIKRVLRNIIRKKDLTKYVDFYNARQEMFLDKLFKKLGASRLPSYSTKYDSVLIGSDEMFNCTEEGTFWGKSMQMFGEGIDSTNIFSYAASFGYTTIDRLQQYGLEEKVAQLLKNNFKNISVRDKNSEYLVTKLTGKVPELHLDPVLIYNFDEKLPKKVKHKNYIAVYGYDNRIKEAGYIEQVKAFAKKTGKKILGIGLWQDWCDENVLADPFEVLAYIRDADYVFCETFHGAIFSIKYNKNFVCHVRESNYNKLYNLLETLKCTDRILSPDTQIEELFETDHNYEYANQRIFQERERTMQYLQKNLTR